MPRIALIGANGQVGAELCVLLAREPGIELVPICRTRSGSAFLRHHGIAVRHGRVADGADARRLFGDCDVVVNAALATGTPTEIRRAEDAIVTNAISESMATARVVHFSTQSVYGDPRPGQLIRWRSSYGRAKVATEFTALRAARRAGKALHVFRLGHVCGELQGITQDIRASLRAGPVVLPSEDVPSNTVYTATIVDAILAVSRGSAPVGVFDLMNVPQWSWTAVHEFEAGVCGVPFTSIRVAVPVRASAMSRAVGFARGALRLAATEPMRHLASQMLAHAPARWNSRGQAWWNLQRARREIAALEGREVPLQHFSWIANGHQFMPGLAATSQALLDHPYRDQLPMRAARWPADLPFAGAQSPAAEPLLVSTTT